MTPLHDFAVFIAGTAWLIPLLHHTIRDIRNNKEEPDDESK